MIHSLPVLVDSFARKVTYLRVSLTDRCNYRCTYCMPEEGVQLLPKSDVLSFEEIERVVRVFAGLGVRRVRLTGGEPTVRKDLVACVERLAAVPGLEVVMTTNGHRLAELAGPLRAAGLRGVNVSLDTLDPVKFHDITRRGDLDRVLAGVDAAIAAGLATKTNVVALKGFNDDEIPALCEHAGPLATDEPPAGSIHVGPARYWRTDGGRRVGIISALSENFCATCNRVRLSAVGELHTCLAYDDATNLRAILRAGDGVDIDGELAAAVRGALGGKRRGHDFQTSGCGGPRKHMVSIGG